VGTSPRAEPLAADVEQVGSTEYVSNSLFRAPQKEIPHMRKVYAGLFSSIDRVVEAPDQWQCTSGRTAR
jgi:hypothetical protein